MSDIVELVYTLRYDRAIADASNAALFEPEHGDPVVGDGKSLLIDLARDLLAQGDCGEQPVAEALIDAVLLADGEEVLRLSGPACSAELGLR